MAREFRTTVRLVVLASAPSSPAIGYKYFDSTLLKARWWNGSAWISNG